MANETVWYVSSSVVVYHLDPNCGALKNVKHALESRDMDLDISGASNEPTMRLCGHCEADHKNKNSAIKSLVKHLGLR